MKILKNFVQNLIKEDVGTEKQIAKLRKWAEESDDDNEQFLLQYDIVPIPTRHDESDLGFGAFSSVYDVIWKDKRAAAKITSSKPDVIAMEKMDELRDIYGDKHIAKVYDIIVHEEEVKSTSRFRKKPKKQITYIIVVEHLKHLEKSLHEYFVDLEGYGGPTDEEDYYDYDKEDEEEELDQNQVNPFEREKKESMLSIDDVESVIDDLGISFENFDNGNELTSLIEFIHNNYIEVYMSSALTGSKFIQRKKDFKNDLIDKGLDKKNFKDIVKKLNDIVKDNFSIKQVPMSSKKYNTSNDFLSDDEEGSLLKQKREKEGFKFEDKRVEEFMNFLTQLEKDNVLNWDDIRLSNVMIRPSTDDLVASDPGIFKFK